MDKQIKSAKSELKYRLFCAGTIFFGFCIVFTGICLLSGLWRLPIAWKLLLALAWNLLLALVPLILSSLVVYLKPVIASGAKQSKIRLLIIILAILWLLFLPNAFYYLTDLMWITRFADPYHGFRPENVTDITIWAALMSIAVAEFMAILSGLVSLRDMHKVIAEKLKSWKVYLVLALIILLNGFAIYMGRFLRFNSWDILLPWRIAAHVVDNAAFFNIEFTLLMSAAIAMIYGTFLLVSGHFYRTK
ncbi:DUF1361 domain-containing protein [Candidatus Saccharibacteria bacterium]|nr:DUF1361 domain-containing protein [Candidatus Saccharibacteria bacterium]MCL1962965.1 DUF1361 domain-containing protein [Candidatus Saccharibacteria bacterium]